MSAPIPVNMRINACALAMLSTPTRSVNIVVCTVSEKPAIFYIACELRRVKAVWNIHLIIFIDKRGHISYISNKSQMYAPQ